jgi:hypothetical protein
VGGGCPLSKPKRLQTLTSLFKKKYFHRIGKNTVHIRDPEGGVKRSTCFDSEEENTTSYYYWKEWVKPIGSFTCRTLIGE